MLKKTASIHPTASCKSWNAGCLSKHCPCKRSGQQCDSLCYCSHCENVNPNVVIEKGRVATAKPNVTVDTPSSEDIDAFETWTDSPRLIEDLQRLVILEIIKVFRKSRQPRNLFDTALVSKRWLDVVHSQCIVLILLRVVSFVIWCPSITFGRSRTEFHVCALRDQIHPEQ
jgi:hypothetical protein